MPINDFATVNVVLAPRAAPRPLFATTALFEILTSAQFAAFQVASSGARLLTLNGETWPDQLAALGILTGSVTYTNTEQHFTAVRVPETALLSARGRFDPSALHVVEVVVVEDAANLGFTVAGDYRISDIEGGDYKHSTPVLLHTQTATLVSAGDLPDGEFAVTFPDGFRAAINANQRDEWTLNIDNATAGTYSFVVNDGTTADVISFVAGGGDGIDDIRAGLIASFNGTANATAKGTISTSGVDNLIVRALLPGVANFLDLTTITGPGGLGVDMTGVNTQDPQLNDDQVTTAIFDLAVAFLATVTSPTYGVADSTTGILTVTATVPNVFQTVSLEHPALGGDSWTLATTVQPRETVLQVRDALSTLVTAGTHPTFTNGISGTDTLVFTAVAPASPISLTTTGPASFPGGLTNSETTSIVQLRVAAKEALTFVDDPATPGFAWDGAYSFTLLGEVVGFSIPVSTSSIAAATIAETALNLAAGGKYSAATGGTATVTITDAVAGRPMLVTVAAPDATSISQVTSQASYGFRDDWDMAAAESMDWYHGENGAFNGLDVGHLTDQEQGAIAAAASDPARIHSFQTDELATTEPFNISSTDVMAKIKNASIGRTFAVYHPSLDAASGIESYEGPLAKWASTVLTKKVGSIQWKGRVLEGNLHGIRFQEGNTHANLKARDASWLERLEARQQNVMNGGYMLDGRIIDIIRALDTLTSNIENAMLDVITIQDIVPYSPDGVALGHEAIQQEIDNGVTDGYVLPRSGVIVDPDLSSATQADRDRGIMPPFTFSAIVQAGVYHLTVNGTISQ